MRTHTSFGILAASFAAILLAAAPIAHASNYRCGQCGTVSDVDRIVYDNDKGTGGAVLGAIIGGVLGNQIGGGSGRTAATIGGAVVGGLVGRNVDRNNSSGSQEGLRLEVRMDRGGYQTIEVSGRMRIYRGDRVRVSNGRVELID